MADTATIITPDTKLTMNDTVATIKSLLDLLGISYPATAVKSDLFALLPAANVDTTATVVSDTANAVASDAAQDVAQSSAVDSSASLADSNATSASSESAASSAQTSQADNPTPDSQNAAQAQSEAATTPVDSEPTPQPDPTPTIPTYTVQAGDSIAKVATEFGMSVGKLKALNVPLTNVLVPGRVLKLA